MRNIKCFGRPLKNGEGTLNDSFMMHELSVTALFKKKIKLDESKWNLFMWFIMDFV